MENSSSRVRLWQREEELIPQLPYNIVMDLVLPYVPWYARPRLRCVSKAWRAALDDLPSISALTRSVAPSSEEGLILVHQMCDETRVASSSSSSSSPPFPPSAVVSGRRLPPPHMLSLYCEQERAWRALPPIPALRPLRVLHDCGVACVSGRVFVMGGWNPATDQVSGEVFMLDLGAGMWQWERRAPMPTRKAFFHCKSVAGRIYAVGGGSASASATASPCPRGVDEEPCPEAYDVAHDRWELLPRVSISRYFHYNGLAAAAGNTRVLAYGFCTVEGSSELANFWCLYNPATRTWSQWGCDLARCSNLVAGDHDLRDGIVHRLDAGEQRWVALEGQVRAKTWRWQGASKVVSDSTCAHGFLAVTESKQPRVYATVCQGHGDSRCLTVWRGDMDYMQGKVTWQQLEIPGSLSTCSEMCYLGPS